MSEAILDPAVLARLTDMAGSRAAKEIVESFLGSAPGRIAAAHEGRVEHDLERVSRELHSLRSSAEMLGAPALSSVIRQMELVISEADHERLDALFERLDREFECFRDELHRRDGRRG